MCDIPVTMSDLTKQEEDELANAILQEQAEQDHDNAILEQLKSVEFMLNDDGELIGIQVQCITMEGIRYKEAPSHSFR